MLILLTLAVAGCAAPAAERVWPPAEWLAGAAPPPAPAAVELPSPPAGPRPAAVPVEVIPLTPAERRAARERGRGEAIRFATGETEPSPYGYGAPYGTTFTGGRIFSRSPAPSRPGTSPHSGRSFPPSR